MEKKYEQNEHGYHSSLSLEHLRGNATEVIKDEVMESKGETI